MSEPSRDRKIWSTKRPLSDQRMTTMVVSTNAYAEKIADAQRMKWGDHRSSAKEIAGRIGAGVGTVRKWLRGENGPSGEHLLKLIAESDEVWAVVLELGNRREASDEERERMRRALAILEGRDA